MSLQFDPVSAGIATAMGLYEHLIKPSIDKLKLDKKRKEDLQSALQRYGAATYTKLSLVRTVVYNEPVSLKGIYHPLKITEFEGETEYEINNDCHFFHNEINRAIIVDYAGMGKSTLSKHIFLRLSENREYIPLFLELRRIKSNKNLVDLLRDDLGSIGEMASPQLIGDLLSLDKVLLILDGFDEIPSDLKTTAMHQIVDIISRYPTLRYLITTRKDGLVNLVPDFRFFEINELEEDDIEQILRKYDPKDIQTSKILKEISEVDDNSFHELLTNPMMVTLLFRSYSYNQEIPSKTYLFYDQVYKSLFNGHDLLKGYIRSHESKLDIHQFQNILCSISIQSIKNGPSYERQNLLNLIETALKRFGYTDISPFSFLSDLLQAVPLFSDEGSEIRWVHKSFQDYFGAFYISFIAGGQAKDILKSIMDSKQAYQYSNMIEICYDMNSSLVEQYMFAPILSNYLEYSKDNRMQGIDKKIYDYAFLRGIIHITDAHEIKSREDGDIFKVWEEYAEDIQNLIPSNGIRMKNQYVGRSYTGTSEAINYWIFEMALKKLDLIEASTIVTESPLIHKGMSQNGIYLFGHKNLMDISDDERKDIFISSLMLRHSPRRRYLQLIDENKIANYLHELSERINLSSQASDF